MPVEGELTLGEFDTLVEEHRTRKIGELNEINRSRMTAEQARAAAEEEARALRTEVAALREEKAGLKDLLAKRQAEWEESVKGIQRSLEAREATVKSGEDQLSTRQATIAQHEDRIRHQWTLLREAVEKIKTAMKASGEQIAGWQQALEHSLPDIPSVS